MRRIVGWAAALLVVVAPGWAMAQDEPKDIVETAAAAGQFNTLLKAAEAAGLVDTLKSPGPFTVFAPTDEAFGQLPEGTVAELLKPENKNKLAEILKYHVVPGEVPASEVVQLDGQAVKTVQGEPVKVGVKDDVVSINDARVVTPDVKASNGLIHVVDKVLLPPAPAAEEVAAAAPAEEAAPAPATEAPAQTAPAPAPAPTQTVAAPAVPVAAMPAAPVSVAVPAVPGAPAVVAVPGVPAVGHVGGPVPTVPSALTGGSLVPGAPAIPGVTSIPGVPGVNQVPGVPGVGNSTRGGFLRRLNPFRNRRVRHAAGY